MLACKHGYLQLISEARLSLCTDKSITTVNVRLLVPGSVFYMEALSTCTVAQYVQVRPASARLLAGPVLSGAGE